MPPENTAVTFPDIFVGEYDHVLDAQGRVSLPSEWRNKERETELMMIPGHDRTLQLLPLATFMDFAGKAGKNAIFDRQWQFNLRKLGSVSRRCRCDKQGRMALDRAMLNSIGVDKKLKLIGSISYITVCAPENWLPADDLSDCLNSIQQLSSGDQGLDALGGMLQGVFGK